MWTFCGSTLQTKVRWFWYPPADEQLRTESREDVDWNAECFTSVLWIWSVLEKLNETVMKRSSTVTIPKNSGKKMSRPQRKEDSEHPVEEDCGQNGKRSMSFHLPFCQKGEMSINESKALHMFEKPFILFRQGNSHALSIYMLFF